MTNKIRKGRETEKEVSDYLEKQGYIIWKTTRNKFQKLDFFGLFDIVARNEEKTLYIQVKTNLSASLHTLCLDPGASGISIYEFINNFLKENEYVIIWVKKEDKQMHVLYYTKNPFNGFSIKQLTYKQIKTTEKLQI